MWADMDKNGIKLLPFFELRLYTDNSSRNHLWTLSHSIAITMEIKSNEFLFYFTHPMCDKNLKIFIFLQITLFSIQGSTVQFYSKNNKRELSWTIKCKYVVSTQLSIFFICQENFKWLPKTLLHSEKPQAYIQIHKIFDGLNKIIQVIRKINI